MANPEAPVRERARTDTKCCCVLVEVDTDHKVYCYNLTTGPDDPFCPGCTDRHKQFAPAMNGPYAVTQELR